VILSGGVVAPGEAGSSEGVRFGVDCSDNRRAQASRIVDSMLTLEQHMVDLTELRDIAKAGAQQRPGVAGLAVRQFTASGMAHHGLMVGRRKLRSLSFIGAAHLCAFTRSSGAVKFWCRRYVIAVSSSWTKLRSRGACKRHAANTSLT
jgi:hypothetical protein